jgi:hypothetical protein
VLLDQPPPKGYGRWSGPLLAAALGDVDVQYVCRFLRGQKIDLAGRKSWCESKDAAFVAKAADVVGLYMAPPENAIVICVDEKPSIQALSCMNSRPLRPLILLNPSNAQSQTQEREAQRAARVIGRQVLVLKAGSEHEIERAFATLVRERAGALLVGGDTFFNSQAILFVVLTARHAIPTIYPWRSYVDAGGLMCYGASLLSPV